MSAFPRAVNRFTSVVRSHDVRPSATQGAQIVPVQNGYSTYATVLGTPLSHDCYEIEIMVREIAVSGQDTSSLTTIGVDRGGGTSFTDAISHLLTGCAGKLSDSGSYGVRFRFPLFIPAGSTIGAKGSINNATVGEQRIWVNCYGKPTHPELVRVGRFVRTFGADTANSRGTALSLGTASEGAWTQVGTVADPNLFAWVLSATLVGLTTASNTRTSLELGIGDGSNKREYITDHEVAFGNNEALGQISIAQPGECANGELIYVRGQAASAQTTWSAIAYAVGG